MKNILTAIFSSLFAIQTGLAATNETSNTGSASAGDTRYGLFNLLDHRSGYGLGVYPEPFLVDDSDFEPGEARFDWVHTAVGGSHDNIYHPEVEFGFDNLTFEVEFPYERSVDDGVATEGFDNVDVGARYPIAQWVSPNGLFDTTAGVGIEAGIPTGSDVGQNAELVPKVFDDLKVGNFTVQSIFGYSALFGPGDDGGLRTFEYGFVFGYTVPHAQLPLPDVLQTIPFFELIGDTELNHENPDHNQLMGNAGLRFNLKAIGRRAAEAGHWFYLPAEQWCSTEHPLGCYYQFRL